MAKGGDYERKICKLLSLWWTDQETDDVFWRSASSGARATQRKKKGKKTAGHSGDITYTDPIGIPFIELITLEIKRGYSHTSVADMIDKHDRHKTQAWEQFLHQAILAHVNAGSPHWMLIHRRDRRNPIVYFPSDLWEELHEPDEEKRYSPAPGGELNFRTEINSVTRRLKIRLMTLDAFLGFAHPRRIKELHKEWKRGRAKTRRT